MSINVYKYGPCSLHPANSWGLLSLHGKLLKLFHHVLDNLGSARPGWKALHLANNWGLSLHGKLLKLFDHVQDNLGPVGAGWEALHPANSWGLFLHGQLAIFYRETHQTRCKKKSTYFYLIYFPPYEIDQKNT